MNFLSSRLLNLFAGIACGAVLLIALYLEYALGLQPCSLCILQRLIFLILAVVLFISVLQNPGNRGIRIYGSAVFVLGILGILAASQQLWLQHHPQQAQVCIPGLAYMMENFPLSQTLNILFSNEESCSIVKWTLLGRSIAFWSLLCFIALALLGIWQIIRGYRTKL